MLSKTTTKPLDSNLGISYCAALFTVLLVVALLMAPSRSSAMHHIESEIAAPETKQLAVAERMIDAFYSLILSSSRPCWNTQLLVQRESCTTRAGQKAATTKS